MINYLEAIGGLVLDPVLEDESQDAGRHLEEQEDGEEDGVGRQQSGVLAQRPHAPAAKGHGIIQGGQTGFDPKIWLKLNISERSYCAQGGQISNNSLFQNKCSELNGYWEVIRGSSATFNRPPI